MTPEITKVPGWAEYYKNKPVSLERISEVANRHRTLLNGVLALNPRLAIEVGIGSGVLGHSLSQIAQTHGKELNVVEVDLEHGLLDRVNRFISPTPVSFISADTFTLPFPDRIREDTVIFHQGLLEHFFDEQIHTMLREQLRVAKAVVASVPSDQFKFKDGLRGDERLLSLEDWRRVIAPFNCKAEYYGENPGEEFQICMTIT